MSANEENRRRQLAEVIELGEELFERALAVRETHIDIDSFDQEQRKTLAGEAVDLRVAAETFFRVLRKLADMEG